MTADLDPAYDCVFQLLKAPGLLTQAGRFATVDWLTAALDWITDDAPTPPAGYVASIFHTLQAPGMLTPAGRQLVEQAARQIIDAAFERKLAAS